jgi:phospholipid transport system substrate-binding protein
MITELSRRTALFAGAFAAMALFAQPAGASATTETYVKENAQAVLNALAQAKSVAERRAQFSGLMEKFADMPRVSNFVLGRYASALRTDPALKAEWNAAFKEYGLAVYETQLDKYRASTIQIVKTDKKPGSKDYDVNGVKRSIVYTVIPQKDGQSLKVDWDLQLYPDGKWRVIDAYLRLTDEAIASLAQQQRDEFVAELGGNGGDVRKLLESVRSETKKMRDSITR